MSLARSDEGMGEFMPDGVLDGRGRRAARQEELRHRHAASPVVTEAQATPRVVPRERPAVELVEGQQPHREVLDLAGVGAVQV
jgi:hypothetical protein